MITKYFLSLWLSFLVLNCQHKNPEPTVDTNQETNELSAFKTIHFKSTDGLTVTANYFDTGKSDAPLILLFHQARYSRGEYSETALKLNTLGFNCLAIDQRSGDEVNGVVNQTHKEAVEKGLPTEYPDALPDLEAALNYAVTELKTPKILVCGSSYSAALTFVLFAKHPEHIDGIIAFSPGEYFTFENQSIPQFAQKVTCPVFITSAKKEVPNWQPIFDAIPSSSYKMGFIPNDEGVHGSKALWDQTPNHQEYWDNLKLFLDKFN